MSGPREIEFRIEDKSCEVQGKHVEIQVAQDYMLYDGS